MTLELPYPPTVNHYWRHNRGMTHISTAGKAYRANVQAVCKQQRVKILTGRLEVRIDVYPPDKRRRDLDNVLKSLLDSLAHGGVYEDDSQIDRLDVMRMPSEKPGKVVVEVEMVG